MEIIHTAKKWVLALSLVAFSGQGFCAVTSSEETSKESFPFFNKHVPVTIGIHPIGIFLGTIQGDLAFGIAKHVSLGLQGSFTQGRWGGDGLAGGSYGIFASYFFSGQSVDSIFIKPGFEHGYLRENVATNAGSIDYDQIKLLAGYHWHWDSGLSLNLGGGANYFMGTAHFDRTPTIRVSNLETKIPNGRFSGIVPSIEVSVAYSIIR